MTDTIPITDTEDFRPRWDGIDKDHDRIIERIVTLKEGGQIEGAKGQALWDTHIRPASERLEAAYFDRKLYAQIETHHSDTSYASGSPPDRWKQAAIDRMIAEDQGARAIRIWRAHLSSLKPSYWYLVTERDKGFRMSKYNAARESAQRRDHDKLIARIPGQKAELLVMMDAARADLIRAGATDAQLDRLALERAEIEAEARTKPEGKPDPRKMDIDLFWQIIGTPADGPIAERIDALPDRLAAFKSTAIKAFDKQLHALDLAAYRADIWALGYLLGDGCSDDAFDGFRPWLVLQGRTVFEATLADPDTFDTALYAGDGDALTLWDAPPLAHEMRQATPLNRKGHKLPKLGDMDEATFPTMLPRVAAAMHR